MAIPRRSQLISALVTTLVLAIIGGVAVFVLTRPSSDGDDRVTPFVPTAADPDPSMRIPGVVRHFYQGGHVGPGKRVRYQFSPPMGGRHDAVWAVCTGIVYPRAIRSENAVHSMEHGATWVTYDPARVNAAGVAVLAAKVRGRDHLLMSPYPGLDRPVSIQSWGHQLKVDSPSDPRIDHFITATKQNPQKNVYPEQPTFRAHPEVGGTCAANGVFDVADPPAFEPPPLPADAVPDA
ncbi:DUF3105 domain-containing protein [Williamsia sp. CHRR-6]|uniref:DUF3105 domain-containing protein n=1 Tax=Williamsia sp. CHRR-6 TaxID=2835871 RepID=UPI001BD9C320|nr:DUF3105 domain-containing protein [Williamsia sp. CHRR-6]MBT0568430.1 DUF3105 domain-containing protein [Williamsia sp. CHRR-6]